MKDFSILEDLYTKAFDLYTFLLTCINLVNLDTSELRKLLYSFCCDLQLDLGV